MQRKLPNPIPLILGKSRQSSLRHRSFENRSPNPHSHPTLTPYLCKYRAFLQSRLHSKPMANFGVTDLCDTHEELLKDGRLKILQPMFQMYGSRKAFNGPIATVKVFEDNVLVREMVEEQGGGRVLVVDGGGSMRCALLGGNLAALAHTNGWSGVIVNGCVRDVEEIQSLDIGVRALAAHPLKSNKKGAGEKNGAVFIGGARIVAGEWCYADCDGVIISPTQLSL